MTILGLLLLVVASHMEAEADTATVAVTGSLTTAHYSTKDLFTLASFGVQIAIIATMSVLNKEHKVKVATGAVTGSLSTAQYSNKRLFTLQSLPQNSGLYCILAKDDTIRTVTVCCCVTHGGRGRYCQCCCL